MNNRVKEMVYAALLIALAIIIPIQFSFLKIYIPPFSATLAAHLPMFIGMLISPMVAVVTGIGSAIGFLLSGMSMPIVFRAATHIVVGYVGAKYIQKKRSYLKMTLFTSIIHGGLEALVVIPFIGFNLYELIIVTGVGAILHHLADGGLTFVVLKFMARGKEKDIYRLFEGVNFKERVNI